MGKIKICDHNITPKSNCRKCRQIASRLSMRKIRDKRKKEQQNGNDK